MANSINTTAILKKNFNIPNQKHKSIDKLVKKTNFTIKSANPIKCTPCTPTVGARFIAPAS